MSEGVLVKAFVSTCLAATPAPGGGGGWVHRGVPFARVWLQGVVVAASADASELSLDDGSGVLQLRLGKEPREAALALAAADGDDRRGCGGSAGGDDDMTDGSATQPPRQPPALLGLPLMVAGKLVVPAGGAAAPGAPFVRVAHVALLAPPNAEPLWGLELVEAWRDLYTSGAAAP